MTKANLFIVGAPKCGTTSLFDYLCQHKAINGSSTKEPFFFSPDVRATNTPFPIADYHDLFDFSTPHKYYLESTTWYLYSSEAAREIFNYHPDAKIIIMLRNPIELMVSLYNFRMYYGTENAPSIISAIKEGEEIQHGTVKKKSTSLAEKQYSYLGVASYAHQIKRYQKIFPGSNIHFIKFDDFKSDTSSSVKDVMLFLGEDPNFSFETKSISNQGKEVKSKKLNDLLSNPPKPLKSIAQILFDEKSRSKIYRQGQKLISRKPDPQKRETQKQEIAQVYGDGFLDDIKTTETLTNLDLRDWTNQISEWKSKTIKPV
ncbi:MAG: sulfotransferase domain-containing protein [Saprospiraceae bacterium]|nr:sulfotransferase domain-containing protein [Saprospiraceae bacterium]